MKKILSAKNVLAAVLASVISITSVNNTIATANVTGEITVSCYDSMVYKTFLEYAARSFEEKYSGVKVNIESFSAMPEVRTTVSGNMTISRVYIDEDSNTKSDYIARINTELMSGGGADIYAIDVIPYYRYADVGMFEDLRQFMDNDSEFDYSVYEKNIFDAAMYKGGQYILPLDYGLNCLSYNSAMLDLMAVQEIELGKYTYKQLMELGYDSFVNLYDSNTDNQIKLFNLHTGYAGSSFYNEMLSLNYNNFVDLENKKANFLDGRFEQILNRAKQYEVNGYISTQTNFNMDYLYKIVTSLPHLLSINDLNEYDAAVEYINFYGLDKAKDDVLIGTLVGDNGESPFKTTQSYGISSNSQNKETAWEFLKFLLSDEMQSSMSLRYYPINKKAAYQKAKADIYNVYSSFGLWKGSEINFVPVAGDISGEASSVGGDVVFLLSGADDIKFNEAQQEIYDDYLDYIVQLTALINTYTIRDINIDEMIENEIKKFFAGSRTAEEVALTLQSKVSIYLQE